MTQAAQVLDEVGADLRSYDDHSAEPGEIYRYTVTAVGADGTASRDVQSGTTARTPRHSTLAAGERYSLALAPDGTVWGWGDNTLNSVSPGADTYIMLPLQLQTPTDIVSVVSGELHALALAADGTVWAWGLNSQGQLGSDDDDLFSSDVVQVAGLSDIIAVAAGGWHSLAVARDGSVWVWGLGNQGQLGLGGSREGRYTPQKLESLSGIVDVSAGLAHSLALDSDGAVWAWGLNSFGQLGLGSTEQQNAPVRVQDLDGVVSLAAGGYHSLALQASGEVWAWGMGTSGQLGHGALQNEHVPRKVDGLNGIADVVAGRPHSIARGADGSVHVWGSNLHGQLGLSTEDSYSLPQRLEGLADTTEVATAARHTMVLRADGSVWAFGDNEYGQLGDGNHNYFRSSAVRVADLETVSVDAVAAGETHSFVLQGGELLGWGNNSQAALGKGFQDSIWPTAGAAASGLDGIVVVAGGPDFSLAADSAGDVWSWGWSPHGALGYQAEQSELLPRQIPGISGMEQVVTRHHTAYGIDGDGAVWSWGWNIWGQLGDSSTDSRHEPRAMQLPSARRAVSVAAGQVHVLVLLDDGSVWAAGHNELGQLGDPEIGEYSAVLRQVPGLQDVAGIAAGAAHSMAITNNGQVYAWGGNGNGQLGVGSLSETVPEPQWVLELENVVQLTAGDAFTVARLADGTLMTWGSNGLGELGLGDTQDRNSPEPIPGIDDAISVAAGSTHVLVHRSDGTVVAWGSNVMRQLGHDQVVIRSEPAPVTGLQLAGSQ